MLWGVTGGRVREGDGAGVDGGERAAAGQRGGRADSISGGFKPPP